MQHLSQRASYFGESFFVTILSTPQKKMLWPSLHWAKISKEMQQINPIWDESKEKKEFQSLIDEKISGEQYLRLRLSYAITNADLPLMIPDNQKKTLNWEKSLQVTPWNYNSELLPIKTASPTIRVLDDKLRFNCKVGSYGHESLYCLKNSNKFDDVLWINPDQRIQECSTANVFYILSHNHWGTPFSTTCYAGTTQDKLKQWLPTQGIKVSEMNLNVAEAANIQGLVFTNATHLLGVLNLTTGKVMEKDIQNQVQTIRKKFFLDMLSQASGQL